MKTANLVAGAKAIRKPCFLLVLFLLLVTLVATSCITINPPPAQAPAPSPTATPTTTLPKLPSIQTFVAPENVPPENPLGFVTARQQIDQTFVKLFGETYYANHPNLVNYYEPHDIGKLTQAVQDSKNLTKWEYKANYFDCSNMSGLMQYALTAAGFETLIVVGYDIAAGERHGHAWVVVILQSQSGVELVPVETTTTGGPTIVGNGEREAFKLGNEVDYQTHDDYISQGYAMQYIYQAEKYSPGDFNWWNSCQIDRSWFARGTVSPNRTPTPTPTSTLTPPPALGYTSSNPAVIGVPLTSKVGTTGMADNSAKGYQVRITLLEIIRGDAAWQRVQNAAQSNPIGPIGRQLFVHNNAPVVGFEYLLARVRFEYLAGPTPDSTCRVAGSWFAAVSASGKDYGDPSLYVNPQPLIDSTLYPGASNEGWTTFMVAKDDLKPLLAFARNYDGTGSIWFALY